MGRAVIRLGVPPIARAGLRVGRDRALLGVGVPLDLREAARAVRALALDLEARVRLVARAGLPRGAAFRDRAVVEGAVVHRRFARIRRGAHRVPDHQVLGHRVADHRVLGHPRVVSEVGPVDRV